jgi:hypothetical protein
MSEQEYNISDFINDEAEQEMFEGSEQLEFAPVSQEITALVQRALKTVRGRSFSGRYPELGKMIKCQVCKRRHRAFIKCAQVFVTKWFEEDLETGVVTSVPAVAAQTRKGVVGAAAFKGKRLHPHLNKKMQRFIAIVRELFGSTDLDPESEIYKQTMKIARKLALRQLKKEASLEGKKYRRQQDISRRINRGLLRQDFHVH